MKSGHNNDEKHMIELLKGMPNVTDSRDKNELFQRISKQMENEHQKQPIRKKKNYRLPIFSTVLVVAIILVIIPVILINDRFQTHDELSSNKAADSASFSEESNLKMDERQDTSLFEEDNPEFSLFGMSPESLVLQEVDDSHTIIHAAVADQQGQYMIPLSFIMPTTANIGSYYNQLENYIKASEWGVAAYLFQDVSFEIDKANHVVIMNLPQGFSLSQGSTNAAIFEDQIATMFSYLQITKVVFKTVNNQGIDLGPVGTVTEMPVESVGKSSYKLYQSSEDTRKFLIPVPQQDQTEIAAALSEMKQDEKEFHIVRTIPNEIEFTVDTSNNQLTVTFSDGNSLSDTSITIQEKITMIDAILMTAKSYGYSSVKFRNTGVNQIGSYKLMEAIKVPLAVNPIRNNP